MKIKYGQSDFACASYLNQSINIVVNGHKQKQIIKVTNYLLVGYIKWNVLKENLYFRQNYNNHKWLIYNWFVFTKMTHLMTK